MAGAAPQIEWYIARDGQQYGPLSDPEMRKFVELGHLRPSDLVWRYGFPDWRPAPAVFPSTASARPEPSRPAHRPEPRPQPQQPQYEPTRPSARDANYHGVDPSRTAAAPVAVSSPYEDDDDDDDTDDFLMEQPRRRWRRIAVVAFLVAILGGAIWLAVDLIPSPANLVALIEAPKSPSGRPPGDAGAETSRGPSLQAANADPAALSSEFQNTPLWQLIKREFPDWYEQRLKEAAQLESEGRDPDFIQRRLAENVVALRKQHAEQALSASPGTLRGIAQNFLENLQRLSAESVDACYGFISKGETSPQVLALMDSPAHRERLQRQVTAVFEAVAEGRRSPQTHLPPRQADYQALTQALTSRGWTNNDIQLFSNPRALAQAPPQEVCRLVQDWFAAQLSIPDEDVQLRLLVESLKPVVAG